MCTRDPSHAAADHAARRWVQSFLAGVPHLALGGRDDAGVLRRVHTVPVVQLPNLSARAGQPWDANMLLRFGDECLAWMAERAAGAGEGSQLRFVFEPAARAVRCEPVAAGGMAARLAALLPAGGGGRGGAAGGGEQQQGAGEV